MCLPATDVDLDEDWRAIFDEVKAYVFVALVDPALHNMATEVMKRFWLCRPQNLALQCVESSRKMLLQTLRLLYSESDRVRVNEEDMLAFLREMRDAGGAIEDMMQEVVDDLGENYSLEFSKSRLGTLFE